MSDITPETVRDLHAGDFYPYKDVPVCYDTLAKGNFKVVADHVIELFNDREFYTPYYSIKQEKKLPEDTVYFNIVLPKDDAFSTKRFRNVLYFDAPVYQKTFEGAFGVIPKSLIVNQHSQKSPLSFSIQDLEPLVRIGEAKSYQRTYFTIFNLVECDLRNNYFTITLLNFNECFVERMDIDKDYIYWDGRNIHWRGKEYKRI